VSSSSSSVSSYIVIGNGPVGSSIAKHLVESLVASNTSGSSSSSSSSSRSEHGLVVTLVDGRPMGMGSSHSDRARLIRTFDAEGDVDWTRWNSRSLEAFPNIERLWNNEDGSNGNIGSNSNISHNNETKTRRSFFTKCGAVLLGDEEFVARSKKAADASLSSSTESSSSPSFSLLTPTECKRKWPYLKPKPGCDVALFDPLGGIIDPLAFIEAQNHNAMSLCSSAPKGEGNRENENENGIRLEILSDAASKIRNGGTIVELASGKLLTATEKIILCGGAYSGSLLETSGIESMISPASPSPALRASKRTVALLEVTSGSVEGILRDMPTIKYAFGLLEASASKYTSGVGEHSRIEAGSVYILPPVFYPEKGGKWFVKVGGGPNDFFEGTATSQREQLDDWLASEGDPSSAEWLGDIGRSLLSTVGFESLQSMACVTTTTATVVASNSNGIMVDDVLGDGSLVAVSACQGKGAGPSDALGNDIVRSILWPTYAGNRTSTGNANYE
jgi:glycine/D-amino acid oxidase-like deaminating enzyme